MASVVEHRRYVKSNVAKNNNKFWYITLYEDNSVITEYGRMGNSPQVSTKNFPTADKARKFFDTKCRQKEKPKSNGEIAYKRMDIIEESITVSSPNASLKEIAKDQIGTNSPETLKLVEYLVEQNAHNILQNTTMTYDKKSGLFETACGPVTQKTIDEARTVLIKVADVVEKFTQQRNYDVLRASAYENLLGDYLMLIPQDIGRKFDPTRLYTSLEDIQKQNAVLDSLEASVQMIMDAKADKVKEVVAETPRLFNTDLKKVEDGKIIDTIVKYYKSTKQGMHSCNHLTVKRVFEVDVQAMTKAFENKGRPLGNVQELWHGTRVSNLLSILKVGLIVPPSNAGHCTGRMFGNGVYFSDQSTKALNYAYGYWGGSRDNRCFMFLADVAMGKSYTPTRSGSYRPNGYDSIFAKAGQSGVRNNEMIVPNVYQCKLKYLVQFG